MPKVEASRYYSGQLVDLYTFNFAYIGSRIYGNDGGDFLVAGPGWSGQTPRGIKSDVIRFETEFAYILFRTQLFNPGDLGKVKEIQNWLQTQSSARISVDPNPPAAPAVDWPAAGPRHASSPALFSYLNLMLQFCPTDPSEIDFDGTVRQTQYRYGKNFDFGKLPA